MPLTETQWLKRDDPDTMVWHLRTTHNATRTKVGKRKLRLFCCACVRQIWDLVLQKECRAAVEVCERFADGEVTSAELNAAWQRGFKARNEKRIGRDYASSAVHYATYTKQTEDELKQCVMHTCLAYFYSLHPNHQGSVPVIGNNYAVAKGKLADLVRDIFGNPFRPVAVDPSWRTSDVVALARGIYAESAFDRLPILADALQDSGCDSAEILDHCRGEGPHVRGCWVVDQVLGK